MNDQQKEQSIDPSEKEFINGAWVDVKLCTVRGKMFRQNLHNNIIRETASANKISSVTIYYNELHYGNYE